jgi:hypothetical protein
LRFHKTIHQDLQERAVGGPLAQPRLVTLLPFKASSKFICDFWMPNHLLFRHPTFKRRSLSTKGHNMPLFPVSRTYCPASPRSHHQYQ